MLPGRCQGSRSMILKQHAKVYWIVALELWIAIDLENSILELSVCTNQTTVGAERMEICNRIYVRNILPYSIRVHTEKHQKMFETDRMEIYNRNREKSTLPYSIRLHTEKHRKVFQIFVIVDLCYYWSCGLEDQKRKMSPRFNFSSWEHADWLVFQEVWLRGTWCV